MNFWKLFSEFVSYYFLAAFALQYTLAMIGYAEEYETTVLELTYNYGVTEYAKGNAYAQVILASFYCGSLGDFFG